jgi:hypothetical protein
MIPLVFLFFILFVDTAEEQVIGDCVFFPRLFFFLLNPVCFYIILYERMACCAAGPQ